MNEVKTLSGRAIKWAKGIKHIVPPASDDALLTSGFSLSDNNDALLYLAKMAVDISNHLSAVGHNDEASAWAALEQSIVTIREGIPFTKSADGQSALLDVAQNRAPEQNTGRPLPPNAAMYLGYAAAVYDMVTIRGGKKIVAEKIANSIGVGVKRILDFRRNLKSGKLKNIIASDSYDDVMHGRLHISKEGFMYPGDGTRSPVENWLKWFDRAPPLKV